MADEIKHYGILRRSGRYPWGSGGNVQRSRDFLSYVEELRKKGMTEVQIAQGIGVTTTELRAAKAIAKNAQRKADMAMAQRLQNKGMSNVAIGKQMNLNESSVRALLNPSTKEKNDILITTANMLKDQIAEKKYLDFGTGTENHIGVSQTKLATAVAMLREEGYTIHYVKVPQLGNPGKFTSIKVLAAPGVKYSEVLKNQDQIRTVTNYSEDGGRSYLGLETPRAVSSKRIEVRYAEQGGADMDGVIQLRRGVDDISLGQAKYAQVRISVDGTHYLKGMAMYTDDLPDGIDLRFNTNKKDTGNKLDAMKYQKEDEDNPFGAVVRQRHYTDKNGKDQLSAINVVGTETSPNEEGNWLTWSRSLSSQVLSKQSPSLAKQQLGLKFDSKKEEFDEIMELTNPAVRKKLLESFADDLDSSAVHLKAAALPRQSNHVILPIPGMKDTEVYAPNYRNGESVVLIRHPHGGKFEIPELTVNNRNADAKSVMGNALDAVGISPNVAKRLSGADFDGDTVLVIPNNSGKIKTSSPLAKLKDFDPQTAYPAYEGMKPLSGPGKQQKMGDVSNLITDMTIRGASQDEIARAVRHSMVVIDAEKHNLNWKQSHIDNGIAQLKEKYQGSSKSGASTLISRASSEIRVPDRKARPAAEGGPIDPKTGKKMFVPTNESWVNAKGQTVIRTVKSTRMAEVDDAFKLSSGTPMEAVYADHANKLKALANEARKVAYNTKPIPYSPSAKVAYEKEVGSLNAKLNTARKNRPLERQAQLLAGAVVKAKKQANPNMDPADLKKIQGQALQEARTRTGARKQEIKITPSEWNAIQAGAISNNLLTSILNNTDLDTVKQLATPRERPVMTNAKMARARAMLASGYTQAEIADALGVPTSTLNSALS